jgi:hypothetical protein
MGLMQACLLQQDDCSDWQHSKYLQFNQYYYQGCFGDPTSVYQDNAVFYLVWKYNIKALDGQKKARSDCDSSSRSGLVQILDAVCAAHQTCLRLFYAVVVAANLLVFGLDVCNTFAEAPPPNRN